MGGGSGEVRWIPCERREASVDDELVVVRVQLAVPPHRSIASGGQVTCWGGRRFRLTGSSREQRGVDMVTVDNESAEGLDMVMGLCRRRRECRGWW